MDDDQIQRTDLIRMHTTLLEMHKASYGHVEKIAYWCCAIQRDANQSKYWLGVIAVLLALILWRVW